MSEGGAATFAGTVALAGSNAAEKKLTINNSSANGIQFNYDNSNNYRNQILNYWNSNTDSRMDFNIARTSGQTPETIMSVGYGGKVGIGTVTPAALLGISGAGDAIRVESTNAGSGGAQMDLLHFTASPADEDIHGVINMGGYYTGTTSVYGSQIKSIWTDVANRHSRLEFYTCDTSVAKVLTLDHAKGATFTGYVVTDGQVGVDTYSPYTGTMLHASGASTSPDTSATNPTDTTAFFTNSDIAYGTLFATHGTGIGEIMQRRTNAATYYDLHLQPHGG